MYLLCALDEGVDRAFVRKDSDLHSITLDPGADSLRMPNPAFRTSPSKPTMGTIARSVYFVGVSPAQLEYGLF